MKHAIFLPEGESDSPFESRIVGAQLKNSLKSIFGYAYHNQPHCSPITEENNNILQEENSKDEIKSNDAFVLGQTLAIIQDKLKLRNKDEIAFKDKSNDAIFLGQALAIIRDKLKLRNKDIAKKAGITSNYFAMIIQGLKTPSPDVLKKIGEAMYDTPVSFIYLQAEILSRKNPSEFYKLLETTEKLVNKFHWSQYKGEE